MRAVGCDLEIVWAQRNGFLHGEAYNVYNATGLACESTHEFMYMRKRRLGIPKLTVLLKCLGGVRCCLCCKSLPSYFCR